MAKISVTKTEKKFNYRMKKQWEYGINRNEEKRIITYKYVREAIEEIE
jgi:hypothetical protein